MSERAELLASFGLAPTVDGRPFEQADAGLAVRDPNTGVAVGSVADVGAEGVDRAVASARRALDSWGSTPPRERSERLLALASLIEAGADEITTLECLDVGKPRHMVPAEIASAVDKVRFFAGAARILTGLAANEYRPPYTSFVRRDPVGVVAAIAPWNYPFALAIWKLAPALAAGNTVVLKPSPETPLSSLLLGRIAAECLPPGVVNVVSGGPATGEALVRHPDVAMVSLTGGTATGKVVMRAASDSLKRVHLELGGNAAVLVFDDADLDRLAEAYYMAAFRNTGQDCHAASRVYTTPSRRDAVVEAIRGVAESITVGDSFAPATTMGPLVSVGQQQRIGALVDRALAEPRVELVTGGRVPRDGGFFYSPTVLAGVEHADEIVREEIFGPVVTVATFDDEADAVRKANDVVYGLAASVWTSSIDRALRVSRQLRVGTVWVNGHGATIGEMPFGGMKESGQGRDLSLWALEQHTDLKHVAIAVER